MSNLCQILYNITGIKDGKCISPYLQEVYVEKEKLIQCRRDIQTKRKKDCKTSQAREGTTIVSFQCVMCELKKK